MMSLLKPLLLLLNYLSKLGPRARRQQRGNEGAEGVDIADGLFWVCGVTPQAVALASKPRFMITHSPGHMFISDVPNGILAAI